MRWPVVFALAGVLGCQTPTAEPSQTVVQPTRIVFVQPQLDMPEYEGWMLRIRVMNTVLESGGTHDDYVCLLRIAERESSLNPDAVGDSGASHGLWQRHAPSWGHPGDWTVEEQTQWALWYSHEVRGGPCEAWTFWQARAAERGGKGWW